MNQNQKSKLKKIIATITIILISALFLAIIYVINTKVRLCGRYSNLSAGCEKDPRGCIDVDYPPATDWEMFVDQLPGCK